MRVELTEKAKQHLIAIEAYYNLKAPHKTQEILTELIDRLAQLETFPFSGPEEEFLKSWGISRRYLVQGNYKIVYRIEMDCVFVTQVFDARQDPGKLLRGE